MHKQSLRAILACVQATVTDAASKPVSETDLGNDLYALIVYLHKNCNSDLFEAVCETPEYLSPRRFNRVNKHDALR